MRKYQLRERIDDLFEEIQKVNRSLPEKRFYAMIDNKYGKPTEFGAYDYITKKYVLISVYSKDLETEIDSFRRFISHA